jgi:hypothetical protein
MALLGLLLLSACTIGYPQNPARVAVDQAIAPHPHSVAAAKTMSGSRAEAIVHRCRTSVITSIGGFKVVKVKNVTYRVIGVTWDARTWKAKDEQRFEVFLRCIGASGVDEVGWPA